MNLVLDNEAVQALADVNHDKHRVALEWAAAVRLRRAKGRRTVVVLAATALAEAGVDRRSPATAVLNRLVHRFEPLADDADDTAALVWAFRVSLTDAHVAVVAGRQTGPTMILTSDVSDLTRLTAGTSVGIARL